MLLQFLLQLLFRKGQVQDRKELAHNQYHCLVRLPFPYNGHPQIMDKMLEFKEIWYSNAHALHFDNSVAVPWSAPSELIGASSVNVGSD